MPDTELTKHMWPPFADSMSIAYVSFAIAGHIGVICHILLDLVELSLHFFKLGTFNEDVLRSKY